MGIVTVKLNMNSGGADPRAAYSNSVDIRTDVALDTPEMRAIARFIGEQIASYLPTSSLINDAVISTIEKEGRGPEGADKFIPVPLGLRGTRPIPEGDSIMPLEVVAVIEHSAGAGRRGRTSHRGLALKSNTVVSASGNATYIGEAFRINDAWTAIHADPRFEVVMANYSKKTGQLVVRTVRTSTFARLANMQRTRRRKKREAPKTIAEAAMQLEDVLDTVTDIAGLVAKVAPATPVGKAAAVVSRAGTVVRFLENIVNQVFPPDPADPEVPALPGG